jgi:hypothetical protein
MLIDVAISENVNVIKKKAQKTLKYKDLKNRPMNTTDPRIVRIT